MLVEEDDMVCGDMAVFLRTNHERKRVLRELKSHDIPVLDGKSDSSLRFGAQGVYVHTMHVAKGQEFPIVFLPSLREKSILLRTALKNIQAVEDKEAFIDHERCLLYVCMTRARDRLFMSWSGKRSPGNCFVS
jgi:ATP-dependent exoDNAse (exonuclease V) beta subunit